MNLRRIFRYSHAGIVHLQRSILARRSRDRHTPLGPPLSVAIGITTKCNSQCLYCDIWKKPPRKDLDTDEWKRVFDELGEWLAPAHISVAGGEPFLRKDLFELINHASAVGLLPSVVTNGTVSSPELITRISELPLASLIISIDSYTPGPHDRLHGMEGAHRRAMALVENLLVMGWGPRLRIAAVLTSLNSNEIVELAKWSDSRGIGGFTVQPLGEPFERDHQRFWYKESSLKLADTDALQTMVAELISLKESGVSIMNPVRQLEALPEYYKHPEHGVLLPCLVGSTTLGIGPDGDLRFCPYHRPFGRWGEGSFKSQWYGVAAAKSREQILRCSRGCSIMNCAFSPTLKERLGRWKRIIG